MKNMWLILILFLLPLPSAAADLHLDYIAAIDPPHHEAINGRFDQALAERYFLELRPSLSWGRLTYYVAGQAHGLQQWHPPAYWGSSREYWSNGEAWRSDQWRFTVEHGGTFDLVGDRLQIYSRFVMPINRRSYSGFYYWRVGISRRLF